MARLFVAAYPPSGVLDELSALPRPAEPGLRWVPREQLHVTLRFLGESDPDEASAALSGLSASPATARLGAAVSRMGSEVLCIPVEGLDELAGAVAGAVAGIGDPVDRPFSGHLTLGRFRHRRSCGLAGTAFSATFEVREVVLVRSTLTSAGARHERLSAVVLDPTA